MQGPYDLEALKEHCRATWGVVPETYWPATEFGGLEVVKEASNIVFSNGLYDPW